MFRCIDNATWRTFAAAGIAAVCSVAAIRADQELPRAPSALAAARDGTVKQFAAALVRTGTPVGVILLNKDVHARPERLQPEEAAAEHERDSLSRAFQARHPEYQVERTPFGGAVILPRTSGWCAHLSQSRVRSLTTVTAEVHEVLYRTYRAWGDVTTSYIRSGLVGSVLGDRPPDPYPFTAYVTLGLVDSSLETALNTMVQQVPGLGWAVQELTLGPDSSQGDAASRLGCNLTLFSGASWLVTSHTIVVPRPPR